MRHNIASHWSCSHDGYWSTVRYGHYPTIKKPEDKLDKTPMAWARMGTHPSLDKVCHEPFTAEATRKHTDARLKAASAAGKAEPRQTEMDLYAVIVQEGFRNTPDDPWAHKKLIQYLKANASRSLHHFAFKIRQKLSALIDDVWAWERVGDDIQVLSKSRWETFLAASHMECICQGQWRYWLERALSANSIDPVLLCSHVCHSLFNGRCESLPVVVLMGRSGGEGKSFFFAPLANIYGKHYVQTTPQPGSFPLLDLEKKRVVVKDEREFGEHTLSLSLQLLWYEGKAFPITRPQNKEYSGHILYEGTAPVFITCKEKWLGPILKDARIALENGEVSQSTMLARRLVVFHFTEKLPVPKGLQIPDCGKCFSQMCQHYAALGQQGK